MSTNFKRTAGSEFQALREAVAGSPIRVPPMPAPAAPIADWANVRRSADADAAILAWIASHVRGARAPGQVH
jgi:hypothetical protein